MLENINLSLKLSKEEYKAQLDELYIRIGDLQRKAWKMKIPIMIVFEGWHGIGVFDTINKCLLALNPVGFKFFGTVKPTEEELKKPLIWRFWQKIPAYGNISIFERSWYSRYVIEEYNRNKKEKHFSKYIQEINDFEKQLTSDGYLIIKFYLHVSKEEQQQKFEENKKKDVPLCMVDEEINYLHEYDNYYPIIDSIIEKTSVATAPWHIVPATDNNYATINILSTIAAMMEVQINKKSIIIPNAPNLVQTNTNGLLSTHILQANLSATIDDSTYKKEKEDLQQQLKQLQYELFKQNIPMVIVFEGWDAAGKGGNIKRIAEKLDPRIYRVEPIAAPNDYEKNHHYLWRFYRKLPDAGHITIFDRSWYGRVLVERVEELCTIEEWKRAYHEINEFEQTLAEFGTIILKFWLHIDKDEQLRRFKDREEQPEKQWKITDDDWRNREKWDQYLYAIDEMFIKTSTSLTPWILVESNDKQYARIKTLKSITQAIKKSTSK